ncbi:hypothetical protein UlMin_035994 [Ulmus minor]
MKNIEKYYHNPSTLNEISCGKASSEVEHTNMSQTEAHHQFLSYILPAFSLQYISMVRILGRIVRKTSLIFYHERAARMYLELHYAFSQIIRAAKFDSCLANNHLPPDVQKLRCCACNEALLDWMRSYGLYIALHLRYEKDMLAFSGCTHDLSPSKAKELTTIRYEVFVQCISNKTLIHRENTPYWKVKEIDPNEQRSKGIFLTTLGYPSNTPVYIVAGEIYGGDSHMVDLLSCYPLLMISVESDIFIPSNSGNMVRAVEGHHRFLGHRKTISADNNYLEEACLCSAL